MRETNLVTDHCPKRGGRLRITGSQKITRGDVLIFVNTKCGERRRLVVLSGVRPAELGPYFECASFEGKRIRRDVCYLADCGVVPYSSGKWHALCYLRLPFFGRRRISELEVREIERRLIRS